MGSGTALVAGPLSATPEPRVGGVFVGCLAAGFLLIPLATLLRHGRAEWWPLIPGVFLGLVSVALLSGDAGTAALTALGYVWPVALLAGGTYVLYRARSR